MSHANPTAFYVRDLRMCSFRWLQCPETNFPWTPRGDSTFQSRTLELLESLNLSDPPLLTLQTSAQLGKAVLACNLSTQVAEAEVQSQSVPHGSGPVWATEEDSKMKQIKMLVRMANAHDPGIQEWKQEGPEFKDSLSHVESLKSVWATQETVWEEGERRGGIWKEWLTFFSSLLCLFYKQGPVGCL